MKIAVYTIALNEAAHVERWANSVTDADYRIVADTGSSDDTVDRLTRAGVTVHRIAIRPWRFDDARNAAMALLPADVDVCCTMDMDRFLEPGWRPKLEASWAPETTLLSCRVLYRSSVDDPTPSWVFRARVFHHRWGYRFKRPVHEELFFAGQNEVRASRDDIVMHEVQDRKKTTRSNYLPLMELAHREDPRDSQICFWLGREYMWAKQHGRAIELLERYLSLPTSTWPDERAEAMRYLARMQPGKKLLWLERARDEAPHRREIWLDLAEELHRQAEWRKLLWACTKGIEETHRTGSYLDDALCWGSRLFDLGALAAWHLHLKARAIEWGSKAVELNPSDPRLNSNLKFYRELDDDLAARKSHRPPSQGLGITSVQTNGATFMRDLEWMAFVCGCGHSGTTLLATILSRHPRIHVPLTELLVFLESEEVAVARLHGLRDESLRSGKTIAIEKTPSHIHKVDMIRRLVPGVRLILMVRDGRDVTASIGHRYAGDYGRGLNRWIEESDLVLKERGKPDVFVMRYEDLVSSPQQQVRDLCAFLGLSYDDELLDAGGPPRLWYRKSEIRHSDGVARGHEDLRNWQVNQPLFDGRGRWKSELPPAIVAEFERGRALQLMQAFGYISSP